MFCDECGSKKLKRVQGYTTESQIAGALYVKDAEVLQCTDCNGILVDAASFELISKYVQQREVELIGSLPIDEFVSLNATAKILGVSKQAVSKNGSIKSGMIMSRSMEDGKVYYVRDSVEEYKHSGDGRLRIVSEDQVPVRGSQFSTSAGNSRVDFVQFQEIKAIG